MANTAISDTKDTLADIVSTLYDVEDKTSSSLFKFVKRSMVVSRVYIDDVLANEEITTPIMLNLLDLYIGLILTALNLNSYITSTKKVRDILATVATEDFKPITNIRNELRKYFALNAPNKNQPNQNNQQPQQQQNNSGNTAENANGSPSNESENPNTAQNKNPNNQNKQQPQPNKAAPNNQKQPNQANKNQKQMYFGGKFASMESDSPTVAEISKSSSVQPLPVGRVINAKLSNYSEASGRTDNATVQVLIQLHPIFVPQEVSTQFIAMNFKPSFAQRWLQMTSGEISFWSDFVLGNDLRRQRYKAMRKDSTSILHDLEERRSNAVSNLWLKILGADTSRQNIANTILIYESRNFKKACSTSGINFTHYDSRQRFFEATMSMIVVVVDIMYSKIEKFYNGISTTSELTFDQCKRNSKTESVDIMTMMKQYAQGLAPKF